MIWRVLEREHWKIASKKGREVCASQNAYYSAHWWLWEKCATPCNYAYNYFAYITLQRFHLKPEVRYKVFKIIQNPVATGHQDQSHGSSKNYPKA